MHIASVWLAFGLVVMTMLTGCKTDRGKLWDMGLDDSPDHGKSSSHLNRLDLDRQGVKVQEQQDKTLDEEGMPSQSAPNSKPEKPGTMASNKRSNHLNTLDDEAKDHDIWELLGKERKPSADVGVCIQGEHRSFLLFRQYVNTLKNLIKDKVKEKYGDDNTWINKFVVGIELNAEKLKVMEEFGAAEHYELDPLQNVHEVMNEMLLYVNFPQYERRSWMENTFGITPAGAAVVLLACSLIIATPMLLHIIIRSCRMSWKWLIVFLFLVSFVWKGYEMYLKEHVKTEVELSNNYGQDCRKSISFWTWMQKAFFYTKDGCHDFHLHTTIDPLWKISPLQVVVVTLSECLWIPLQTAGQPIAKFVNDLLSEVPYVAWPFVGSFAGFLLLLVCTLISGSRLRLAYGLIDIGHRTRTLESLAPGDLRTELQALKNEVATLRQENALLQSQREAIEMDAGGDAQPGQGRLAGPPAQKAVTGAKHIKGHRHIDSGNTARLSVEYNVEPMDADSIGPRYDTSEPVSCATEARAGQGVSQTSSSNSSPRDRNGASQINERSAGSTEISSGQRNHTVTDDGDHVRSEEYCLRPVTIRSPVDNEDPSK